MARQDKTHKARQDKVYKVRQDKADKPEQDKAFKARDGKTRQGRTLTRGKTTDSQGWTELVTGGDGRGGTVTSSWRRKAGHFRFLCYTEGKGAI